MIPLINRIIKSVVTSLLILLVFFGNLVFAQKIAIQGVAPEAFRENAVVSASDNTLFYVERLADQCIIYSAPYQGPGIWGTPTPIYPGGNQAPMQVYGISINATGERIYFSANLPGCGGAADIYFTEKKDGKWSAPVNLGTPINGLLAETTPSISFDEKFLYFAMPRTEQLFKGFECKEIYYSEKLDDGTWSNPRLLPVPVNFECEDAPVMSYDNKTLFFSSIRDRYIGDKLLKTNETGFDLYFSKKLAEGVWSEPAIIESATTETNDRFLFYGINGTSYITRATFSNKKNLADIFTVTGAVEPEPVAIIKGSITDMVSKEKLNGTVIVSNPETSRKLFTATCNQKNNEYFVLLQKDQNYALQFYNQGYSHTFSEIDLTKLSKVETITKNAEIYRHVNFYLNIFDKELFEPLSGKITVTDLISGQPINAEPKEYARGKYLMKLPIGSRYSIKAESNLFESDSMTFDITDIVQFDTFEKDMELVALTQDFEISVADLETDITMDVEIEIRNLDNDEVIIISQAEMESEEYMDKIVKDETGKYTIKLRQGGRYSVNVRNPKGYAYYNANVDLNSEQEETKLDVKLTPLTAKTKLALNNITFEYNSAELNAFSFTELDRLVKLLQENPEIRIEISAHTDNKGADEYNLRLSDRRAQSVVNYLIEKEISSIRMVAKGYGKNQPLVPNDTEENMAMNRRVELKIIDVNTNE